MDLNDNLSAVLHDINVIKMEQTPVPDIEDHEVLLRMSHVGICGSDIHFYTKGRIGRYVLKTPMRLGHEGSGTVVKCGKKVNHLVSGDRVAIEPGSPCRCCDFCKLGRYNLCDVEFGDSPPIHGNICRYYKQTADFCYKLPDHVSMEEGALCEPLGVAVNACRRANITIGCNVLICGAGAIGLATLLCARAMGASKICITDVVDHRLKLAKEIGADETINVSTGTAQELALLVSEKLGLMPDITIECCGVEASISLGILATKSGGVLTLVGVGPPEVKTPLLSAALREVDIRGNFKQANCYPTALSLIASGKVDMKPLVTHRFKLEETAKAFETATTGTGNPVKIMISC